MILPAWFINYAEDLVFLIKKLKKFCLPVKIRCLPAGNINDSPAKKTVIYFDHEICN